MTATWWGTYAALAADHPTYTALAGAASTYGDAGWSGVATMEGDQPAVGAVDVGDVTRRRPRSATPPATPPTVGR